MNNCEKLSLLLTPSYLSNKSTQTLRLQNVYTHTHTNLSKLHAHCLWSTCLQKSQRTWRNNTIKKRAQKIHKSTNQYYSCYTRFFLVLVGFRKSGKANLKKTINLLSCIKWQKTYQLMTFPPKMESRHRQKKRENQTLLSSHYHTRTRSLTYMWNPPPE